MVSYDLHNPHRDYEKVRAVLESADSWAHPQGSVWLVDTLLDTATWRDNLKRAGDANDEFLVIRLGHSWASSNMDDKVAAWLKDPSRRW
ncbi:MAG: hypothetical protein QOK28_3369 [Actinomycetota bacterium]|jgi:hypothetical protein